MSPLASKNSGIISVYFLMILALLIGLVSLSLYVGRMVTQKIELANHTDFSQLAINNHISQGLNMIAVNNLSIGAATHISASVPIVATYLSILKAFTITTREGLKDAESYASGRPPIFQTAIYDRLAHITKIFTAMATGLTGFNDFIFDHWTKFAPFKGIEVARFNMPGALVLPFQKNHVPNITFSLDGLLQTYPEDTMCHTIRASRGSDKDNPLNWLIAPVYTFSNSMNNTLNVFVKIVNKLHEFSPLKLGFVECGYGLKITLSSALKEVGSTLLNKTLIGKEVVEGFLRTVYIEAAAASHVSDLCEWTEPTCARDKGIYAGEHLALTSVKVVTSVMAAKDFSERAIFALMLRNGLTNSKKSSVSCEKKNSQTKTNPQKVEKFDGHVPYREGNDDECMEVSKIDWICPFEEQLQVKLTDKHNKILEKRCKNFNKWDSSPADMEMSFIQFNRQMNAYAHGHAGGFNKNNKDNTNGNVKRVEEYPKNFPDDSGNKKRWSTFGFLIPKITTENGWRDYDSKFAYSLETLSVVASPLYIRRDGETCPDIYKNKSNTVPNAETCAVTPLEGIGRLTKELTSGTLDANEQTKNKWQAMSYGLQSYLERTQQETVDAISVSQFAMSQAMSEYSASMADSHSTHLFWPAWRSKLKTPTGHFVNRVVEKLVRSPAAKRHLKIIEKFGD